MEDNKVIDPKEIEKKKTKRTPMTFMTVFFSVVLVFFFIQGAILLKNHSVKAYNIGVSGSDNVTGSYRGIVLRDEKVIQSHKSGYVTFYATEGQWISAGDYVMTVDENGDLSEKLRTEFYGRDLLSYGSRLTVQKAIKNAVRDYDPNDFQSILTAKANLEETILNCLIADGGDEVKTFMDSLNLDLVKSQDGGFFMTWVDGMESLSSSDLKREQFTDKKYAATRVTSGSYVKAGQPMMKIASDNRFQIAFLLSPEEMKVYSGKKNLSIRTSDGLEISGEFSVAKNGDGEEIGLLTFAKYGGNFLTNRFVEFQVTDKTVTGYKIPESAIVEKSFFVAPKSYLFTIGENQSKGVMVKRNADFVFVSCTVYEKNANTNGNIVIGDDVFYFYSDQLNPGDVIQALGAEAEQMTLAMQASVEGVYQINNGYCVFKPIVRLQNSLETSFVVISNSVSGGLKSYDRIVMDARDFKENEIIFE